jgi:hypothetical protein
LFTKANINHAKKYRENVLLRKTEVNDGTFLTSGSEGTSFLAARNNKGRHQALQTARNKALDNKSSPDMPMKMKGVLKKVPNNVNPPIFPRFSIDIDSEK